MKLNENFMLRQVADNWVVLPLGESSVSFNGMVSLNETAVLLWNELERGTDEKALAQALTAQYDVDSDTAAEDVKTFLETLRQIGCLEE